MNLVFVNHAHPKTQHVAAMRLWYLAGAMAARGHRIVQVCEWLDGHEGIRSPSDFSAMAAVHDWSKPLIVSAIPRTDYLLKAVRYPGTPAPLRKALVATSYALRGGVFSDFHAAALKYVDVLSSEFQPNAVWATFGNTDSWLIAQAIAHKARSPWVADMKDPWDAFVPSALRRRLAQRFKDMTRATCNSAMNASQLEKWFDIQPDIVYSGVDRSFLETELSFTGAEPFRFTLTGSVYNTSVLGRLIDGLQEWLLTTKSPARRRRDVEIIYAGADRTKVQPFLDRLTPLAEVRTYDYLPISELAAICASATVNAYIWNSRTFHHKLLELLCSGRPVISFPGETEESQKLAQLCGGGLFICSNAVDLCAALTSLTSVEDAIPRPKKLAETFSWDAKAIQLESIFKRLGKY